MIGVEPPESDRGPVLLLGVAPRSGTNYVYGLLRQHPHLNCATSVEVPEHFLVRHSRLLVRYADTLAIFWGQHWRRRELRDQGRLDVAQRRSAILAAFGRGLIGLFSAEGDDRRVVTKTPSVDELPFAFELFPTGHVIVVMRDGRGVCESAHKSAGADYELTMQRWARSARLIDETRTRVPANRMIVLRYEDVVVDQESALRELFAFLGVDPDVYDYRAAEDLPVLGSSQHYGSEGKWQRVERRDDFDPMRRWESWDHDLLERFDHVAGHIAARFGYDVAVEHRHGPIHHRVRSIPWILRSTVKSKIGLLQRRLYRLDVFGRRPLPHEIA